MTDDKYNHESVRADRPAADEVAERVRRILSAAEAGASAIVEEAVRDAAAIREAAVRDAAALAARTLEGVGVRLEAIQRQVAGAHRQYDALAAELGCFLDGAAETENGSAARIEEAGRPAAAPDVGEAPETGHVEAREGPAAAPPAPAASAPGPTAPPRLPGRSESDLQRTARLIALPMAVAGRSREEVERHLCQSLGLTDPASVLDHVFGSVPPPT